MALYILIAVLCVVPLASSMFLPHSFGHSFDLSYDMPDTKILRRNAFGQLQAYDVSHDQTFVRNAAGGISRYNIMELSDPEVYSNTVGGGPFGLQSPLLSALSGFGNAGLPGRSFGATVNGLGATVNGLGATTLGATTLGATTLGATTLGATTLGATANSLGTTAAGALSAATVPLGSSFNSLKGINLGMNTLKNYVGSYDPFSTIMF